MTTIVHSVDFDSTTSLCELSGSLLSLLIYSTSDHLYSPFLS